MIIYEGTNNLVSGAFLKCFSISKGRYGAIHQTKTPFVALDPVRDTIMIGIFIKGDLIKKVQNCKVA